MNAAARPACARRLLRAFDYIDRHLAEPLDAARLSRAVHCSKYHFHRQFTHSTGVTVGRYLHLARLRRASYRLAFRPLDRISDIAHDTGFAHAESFSRAFRAAFGQTPREFRARPDWQAWVALFRIVAPRRIQSMQVRIETVQSVLVAVLEHRGPPALVNAAVQKFIEWRRESGLSPVDTRQTYAIAYDDPRTTPPDAYRLDLCGAVDAPVPQNRFGVVTKTIPGGRCAVVRHEGSLDDLSAGIGHLCRVWLPDSGEQARDFPVYFRYLNLRRDTPEHELLTDIHLPLR